MIGIITMQPFLGYHLSLSPWGLQTFLQLGYRYHFFLLLQAPSWPIAGFGTFFLLYYSNEKTTEEPTKLQYIFKRFLKRDKCSNSYWCNQTYYMQYVLLST